MQKSINVIYEAAVSAVNGANLIRHNFHLKNDKLQIHDKQFTLNKLYLIGFGKAVLGIAEEVEKVCQSHLVKGILSVPFGSVRILKPNFLKESKIEIKECAKNNLPDEHSCENTQAILNLVQDCTKDDILLVLISGGGSACLSLPKNPLTLEEKLETIKLLVKSGANIQELNTVRKKLSAVKGGQLALFAYPATIISLIISDVVGDSLADIASGPTFHNNDSSQAKHVLGKYALQDKVLPNIMKKINTESPTQELHFFENVHNIILGNNRLALDSANEKAKSLGYQSVILSSVVEGFGDEICATYLQLVKLILKLRTVKYSLDSKGSNENNVNLLNTQIKDIIANFDSSKKEEIFTILNDSEKLKLSIINGGEITWKMKIENVGQGGRNLHLTLLFQYEIAKIFKESFEQRSRFRVCFSSAGTDGIDGVTDAAGSIATSDADVDLNVVKKFLDNFDSYNFYRNRTEDLLKPGHTGTNVMDLHILLIEEI